MTATALLTPAPYSDLALSGAHWAPVGAGRPWSVQGRGACWRFETRDGSEHADYDAADSGIQRAELCSMTRLPYGRPSTLEFDLLVEPGPVTDREWLIPAQVHQDDVPGNIGSPPFCLDLVGAGGREWLAVRADTSACKPLTDWSQCPAREVARAPFVRGVLHHVLMRYVDGHGTAKGLIHVEVDGAVIAHLEAVTGFAFGRDYAPGVAGSYWKCGHYAGPSARRGADARLVTHVQNPSLTLG